MYISYDAAVATAGHDVHLMFYGERRSGMFAYAGLLSTRGTAIPWYAPVGGSTPGQPAPGRGHGRRPRHLGPWGPARENGRDGGYRHRRADTALTARMTEILTRGPVTFSDLERCVYPPAVHDVIPWASSVTAVHLLEALESGTAQSAGAGFQLSGDPR
jgi:hypothetical protein